MLQKILYRSIAATSLALSLAPTTIQSALATKNNFQVVNRSATDIVYLYVSSSGRTTWDNDILGNGVLSSGSSITVGFGDPSPTQCLYDFKAVFTDGEIVEDYGVDVCTQEGVIFHD